MIVVGVLFEKIFYMSEEELGVLEVEIEILGSIIINVFLDLSFGVNIIIEKRVYELGVIIFKFCIKYFWMID